MKPTRIVAVRHGETEWNSEGRFQGQLDSPLTDNGCAQGRAVADSLAAWSIAAIYSSDLGRARSMADEIAVHTSTRIIFDPRLRERHFGVFQGLTVPEIKEQYPKSYPRFRSGDPDYVIPQGESARQRYRRSVECVEEATVLHGGETIAVVAHGGVLDGLFRRALSIPLEIPRRFSLPNAGLNVFSVEGSNWQLQLWGDTGHLTR